MTLRWGRAAAALALVAASSPAQRWQDTCGATRAGAVAMAQALRDVGTDALVLLVASHPDDRYVLPAVWLHHGYGARIAVLLATRGGGGQNSVGPETGDGLERIRTLETEAGCASFDGEVWYLDRPDAGYRRSAEETFAEWGRESTQRDLARLCRAIRPDMVLTTHNAEEQHGHDLALVELLPEALRLAADPTFACGLPPHAVAAFLLGGGSVLTPTTLRLDADRLEPTRGATLRRLAHDILRNAHVSPGAPAPLESVFPAEARFEPQPGFRPVDVQQPLRELPSLFDPGIWPGPPERAEPLARLLGTELPAAVAAGQDVTDRVVAALVELRALRRPDDGDPAHAAVQIRLARRIASLERLLLLVCGVQLELEVPPGTVAIDGEEFSLTAHVHLTRPQAIGLRAEGIDGVEVTMLGEGDAAVAPVPSLDAALGVRLPLDVANREDPMARRFRGDRFVPPVRLRFRVAIAGTEVPVELTVPVEQRAAVELTVVPRMLLLPTDRHAVQFSVGVTRNSRLPIESELEVRGPAGYAIHDDRRAVSLTTQRADMFAFAVDAPAGRKPGVDVLRIRLGEARVALPVHKIDVRTPPALRVGLVRSNDDTLPGILGVGGLGVAWSELSDADIAVANLAEFDAVVVDVRALRDRPDARRGFRRLLEFAAGRGHRLVVFYQKDIEFHPAGEGFVGAPFAPFQIGRARVTRADAPVRALAPDHVLLTSPNRIQPSDWDGWEQERCLYLPAVYGSQYEEVLAMQDPGQPIERGALLYARHGDGEYVYCALALWRQLKKLHPGAVRLLANLITPAGR